MKLLIKVQKVFFTKNAGSAEKNVESVVWVFNKQNKTFNIPLRTHLNLRSVEHLSLALSSLSPQEVSVAGRISHLIQIELFQ